MTDPQQAACHAADRHGINLPAGAAADVAKAVLACHDTQVTVKARADRDQWAEPACREDLRERMRRQIFAELGAAGGYLPTALPAETRSYLPQGHWMPGADAPEVPAHLAEAGDADWETVVLTLTMPVRKAGS